MQVESLEDFLTPREVASLFPRTSVDTVRRMIRNGDLKAVKTYGGRYLVHRDEAQAARRRMTQPASRSGPASLTAESNLPSEFPGQEVLL